MNGYSEEQEERWANSRLYNYLAEAVSNEQAEEEARQEEQAWYDAYYGDEQFDVEQRRFIPENDVEQVSERDREELRITDNVLAFWNEYHALPF